MSRQLHWWLGKAEGTSPAQMSGRVPDSQRAVWNQGWLFCLLLVAATIIAYQPAWHAGFIWDDDRYVTKNLTLHGLDGLWRIWFEVGATPQFYPLVHSSFWLEHQLWGLNPLGYHVVNVLLQALAAILFWRVLVQLELPGAWLAAAIFALHPVQVESVAWVTERKNVLSGVFYFAAALTYLRFEALEVDNGREGRRWYWYLGALILFAAALLSKTVTCSLPAVLLLVRWWKKGRLRRGDILPTLPFFATGIALGLLTVWMEEHVAGARGSEWSLTLVERCLVAGRALWFYAGKLIWPAELTFIYPRWAIDADAWWQWTFPVAAVGLIVALWLTRRRFGRGPLVAVLIFAGTLFPALGFVNVYPMRYSFVADHFQYLAGVGLIALCAAGLSRLPQVIVWLLPLALGVLTWQQVGVYQNLEILWRDTLKKNPACWMAHNNLANCLTRSSQFDEALIHYRAALDIKPDYAEGHYNMGIALARQGLSDDAISHLEDAVRIEPDYAEAHNNLGLALVGAGRVDEGIKHLEEAVKQKPRLTSVRVNLAGVLAKRGQFDEAINQLQEAIRLDPHHVEAQKTLAIVLNMKEAAARPSTNSTKL